MIIVDEALPGYPDHAIGGPMGKWVFLQLGPVNVVVSESVGRVMGGEPW